jgi:hypothetical protein
MSPCVFDNLARLNLSSVEISDEEVTASLAAYVVSFAWIVVNYVFFRYWKNSYSRTKVRVGFFAFTFMFGLLLFSTGFMVPIIIGPENFPCWLIYVCNVMAVGLFHSTNYARDSTFMLLTGLSFSTQKNGRISLEKIAKIKENEEQLNLLDFLTYKTGLMWYGLKYVFQPNSIRLKESEEDQIQILLSLKFLCSWKGSRVFTLLILLPYILLCIIICLSIPAYRNGCSGCLADNPLNRYSTVVLSALLFAQSIMFGVKCRKLPDVWGVYFEETLTVSGMFLGFTGVVFICFSSIQSKYMFNILLGFGGGLAYFLTTGYQMILAMRYEKYIPHARHVVSGAPSPSTIPSKRSRTSIDSPEALSRNLLNGGVKKYVPSLTEVMNDPELTRRFEIHLAIEYADENLNFLRDAAEWRIAFNDVKKSSTVARAKKIINNYIKHGGLQQINISWKVSEQLLSGINGDPEEIREDFFDDARLEIAKLLEIGAVYRFKKSNQYADVLTGEIVVEAFGSSTD